MSFTRLRAPAARLGGVVVFTTAASLIASSTAAGHQPISSTSSDRHEVEIESPTSDAPVEADGGESFDVGFSTDVPWRYSLEVRGTTADGEWSLLDGDDAEGRADRGENTVEVQVPEDLDPGQYDLRVRLFLPNNRPDPPERAADTVEAGLEVVGDDPPGDGQYSTGFTEDTHTIGEPPAGWSEFRGEGNWSVQNAPRRLQAEIASGGRQGLMWDTPGDDGVVDGDVEVAGLVRGQTTGNALFQMTLQASGDGTDYYYVDAWPSNGNIRINRFVDNSFSTLESGSAGFEVEEDAWYQVVFRRAGDELAAKMWPFGEQEPDEWQVTATDASHDRGQVGVTHLNEGTINDWAWFAAATGGEQAERAPSDVFEPGPDAELAEVDVTPEAETIEVGDTLDVSATAVYDDGAGVDVTTTAEWASGDEAVATVTADGTVTAVEDGATEITATYEHVVGTAEITVTDYLPPTTGFEDRDGDGWTTHDEELDFLQEVADESERVSLTEAGQTAEGRPLHLVRVDHPEAPDDADVAEGQSILAVGSQHGNEPAGREAALQHLRDMAFTDDADVLKQFEDITMLYIPNANPDGREANTRGNSDGIDINRDHHLLETAEATAIAETIMQFDPEIVLDMHERPSSSEPDMELLWPRNLNVDEDLRQLNIELVQDHLRPALEDADFTTGLYGSPTGSGSGDERISRNVFGLRHAIGLLTETAGEDLPSYRVDSQVLNLEQTLGFFHDRSDDVVAETTDAPERRQAHGADQGAFYLDGRDDVSPPPADGVIDPGVCGYVLAADEAEKVKRHIDLFGIEVETLDDGRTFIGMDQPMMTIVPFLVDPRAHYQVANGLVVDDCGDIPDPPGPAQYSTGFTESEHEVGEQPAGWRQFRREGDWSVQNAPRRLQAEITPSGRQGLMWEEPGNVGVVEGDVELSGLVRGQTTGNALFQMTLQASGDGTDYYYVDAWPANGNIRINRFVDNSFSTLQSDSAGFEVEEDAWYQVVFRREGDELSAKMWPFGEDEPDEWQVSTTDANHDRGQVGVTHLDEGTINDWAWFAAATGGQQAERAPSDVFEPDPDAELAEVEVTPTEPITTVGGTVEFTASAVYDDGNGRDVTSSAEWASADESIATVSADGVVTAVAEGTTEITATYEGVAQRVTFVVDEDHVETGDGSHSFGIDQVTTADGGMVAAADGLGSDAGAQMLDAGGNAVDAAVATAFTLAVVEPTMSNLGGRAQMMIRLPDGEYVGIDGGTEVPSNYDPDQAPPSHASGRGYGTVALPGVVAALTEAHDEHGSLPLTEVMAPAIELATEGFALPARQADFLSELATVSDPQYEAAQEYFLQPDGTPYEAGDTLVQEDLAGVLEAIAQEGGSVFYEGWIAETIAEDMGDFGGFLTSEELAGYSAEDGVVVDGSYHDHDLYSLYDPSRGQVSIQALQMMEHFDMAECAPGAGWASIVHQAYRIGMDDRSLPPDEVTSREHAAARAQDITDHCDPNGAEAAGISTTTADPAEAISGDPTMTGPTGPSTDGSGAEETSSHTTHLSTADPDGMAVTLTQTLGPANGSMVATEGLGFLYASTMGYAGSSPGTRPSTNLTPMIVERDGELAYVLGAAGGARIVTAVLSTMARTIDQGLSFPEAVAAPRLHPTSDTAMRVEDDPAADVYWPDATLDGLDDLGYSMTGDTGDGMGRIHAVEYDADTEVFTGVADPRREGQASGS